MTPLDIPDEVVERAVAAAKMSSTIRDAAGRAAGVFYVLPDIVRVAIHSAGPLLVAAELERLWPAMDALAGTGPVGDDDYDDYARGRRDGLHSAGTELYRRAAKLRGEAKS